MYGATTSVMNGQGLIRKLLDDFEDVPAGITLVFVERHTKRNLQRRFSLSVADFMRVDIKPNLFLGEIVCTV